MKNKNKKPESTCVKIISIKNKYHMTVVTKYLLNSKKKCQIIYGRLGSDV